VIIVIQLVLAQDHIWRHKIFDFLSFIFFLTEIRFEAFAKLCNLKGQSSNPTRDSCKIAISVTIINNSFPALFYLVFIL
jgi:hypothetical protein